jgi:hypothetical protein
MPKTIILYHGNCHDGFAGAYAAWKKFGDAATYIPVKHGKPFPEEILDAHVYLIDFCYPKEMMEEIVTKASSVVVLDHHAGIREVIESIPEHIFDNNHSGGVIAWNYFHPDTPLPYLFALIEKGDLHQQTTKEEESILSYAYTLPFDFLMWEMLVQNLESEEERTAICAKGTYYREHFVYLTKHIAETAEKVTFEGHTCVLVSAPRIFATDLGDLLIEEGVAFALITSARADGVRVSMRAGNNQNVDLALLAQKYGGNGHRGAAAFLIPWGTMPPFTSLPKEPL